MYQTAFRSLYTAVSPSYKRMVDRNFELNKLQHLFNSVLLHSIKESGKPHKNMGSSGRCGLEHSSCVNKLTQAMGVVCGSKCPGQMLSPRDGSGGW